MSSTALEDDRFTPRGELGSGGMGVVYRVFDRQRGVEVALKSLRATGACDIYRFKREFRMLAELAHPNLVTLHELFEVSGQWMFTMELVEGTPLHRWVRPGGPGAPFDEGRARRALVQLVDGLAALHAAGKLHRDLKPSNVLVEADGRVVILDFGLVSDTQQPVERTHVDAAIGTPAYMSPEQAADRPLSSASDLYSLGAILYELLTGRRPFEGPPMLVLHDKQQRDPPPVAQVAPDAPADLAALSTMLLARDPSSRPSAVEVLALLGEKPSAWTERIAVHAARDARTERAAELELMCRALEDSRDHVVMMAILGPRGAGKTSLLDAFCASLSEDAVVLRARASDREELSYRVADWLVDAIASYLVGLEVDQRTRFALADIAAIGRVFPSFRRVPGAELSLPSALASSEDELRMRAFHAIFAVVRRISDDHPVAIIADDSQHGRVEAARIPHRLLERPDAPRVLVIYAHEHEHDPPDPMLSLVLSFSGDLRTICLPPPGGS